MPTIETSIEDALFGRVETFSHSPPFPIFWADDPQEQVKQYIRVDHIPNGNARFLIGSQDPQARMGILQLTVKQSITLRRSDGIEVAGLVVAHFPTDYKMRNNGIVVRVMKAPEIAHALKGKTHWEIPVTVYYQTIA